MAYIPPHKRHTDADGTEPSLSPSKLAPKRSLGSFNPHSPGNSKRKGQPGGKIIYAGNSISRWWLIGLSDDGRLPPSVELQPADCRLIELKRGEKPLAFRSKGDTVEGEERPWMLVMEQLLQDLVSASENVKRVMESENSLIIKPTLVARFGKLFFHGDHLAHLSTSGRTAAFSFASMKQARKTFYTHTSDSYLKYIESVVIPKIGMEFEAEKEHYHIKVGDKNRPDATISCKCNFTTDDGGVELYKMELNHVRQFVADISCLHKDLDLRLMMSTKRVLKKLNDEEEQCISELVKSAILDPKVKGGLRWPLGKESSGDRFSVVGCWHTKYKAFKNSSTRLKLRNADRFDFMTSTGEDAREVTLKLKEVFKYLLKDGTAETGPVSTMLQEKLQMIWDNFLTTEHSLS